MIGQQCSPGQIMLYVDGSFTPASSHEPARMGWAVAAFVHIGDGPAMRCLGVLCDAVPDAFLDPMQSPSAYVAECAALFFAGLLAVQNFAGCSTCFIGDCQSALDCSSGGCSGLQGRSQSLARSVHFLRSASSPGALSYIHVHSHDGTYGNEVVDSAAKIASRGHLNCGRAWGFLEPWLSDGGRRITWAGLVCRSLQGDASLPDFLGGPLGDDADLRGMSATEIIAPFLPTGRSLADSTVVCGPLSVRIASVNVLTLNSSARGAGSNPSFIGLARQTAKPAILARCLDEAGIAVAALQETRCERGVLRTLGYLRFCSLPQCGQYGTELWFKMGHAIFKTSDYVCAFQDGYFLLLHDDPRRILIRYKHGGLSLTFCSVHAPHRATEAHLLTDWWTETGRLCKAHSRDSLLILAGDFNANLGSVLSECVHGHGAEQEDHAGSCVHDLARLLNLWVPSTFPACHWGESWTYRHKHGDRTTRIDYVLLPDAWKVAAVNTWTDPAIHAGQPIVDHVAAILDLHAHVTTSGCAARHRCRRPNLDEAAILHPANRQTVLDVIQRAPQVPWHVSSRAHAAILVRHLQDELGALYPRKRRSGAHAFLSDASMDVRKRLSQARHQYARLRNQVRQQTLRLAFTSWVTRDGGGAFVGALQSPWRREAHVAAALCGWQIGTLARQLRAKCASDKASYLVDLATRISSGSDGQAFGAVRKLLCHKRKKPFALDVLPALRRLDGTLCSTPCSVAKRWREHFSALEGGVDVGEEDLLRSALAPTAEPWPCPPCIASVPTITCLEGTLKSAPRGKAPGPDGIPNGVGVACPDALAEKLYPIALKVCLRGSEPIGFKSGLLCKVFKGRGAHDSCSSFRGILLLPTPAKALHKCLRPGLATHFERTAVPGQLSGRKGKTATFASHAMRGFFRSRLALGESVAVVYADVSAAYYRAVRQLSSKADGPIDLASICKGLDIAPDDLAALQRHIQMGSALDFECADPWLQRLATELNSGTWMSIAGDDGGPIATMRGSRPGSSWADLMFGLLMKRLIARRDELLQERQQPALVWDARRTFAASCFEDGTEPEVILFGDQVWADDLATPLSCQDASQLPSKVASAAGALTDAFAEHAMELTFGPVKTAAVMALRGSGSREVRRLVFGGGTDGTCSLTALREHCQPCALPLVDSYRHLGTIHSYDGSLAREIWQRTGQAWGSFREGRRQVYRNKLIPPHKRCEMLVSFVVSKLLVGAGAWPPLRAGEAKALRGALYSMYRAILCLPRDADLHIHACTLRARIAASSPCALLHAARLRYAAQMVRSGPDHLWAITKADRPYCDLVMLSFSWLFARVQSTCGLRSPCEHWEEWEAVMLRAPGKFKGWIKRALALEKAVDACASAHAELYKLCRRRVADPSQHVEGTDTTLVTEACIVCRKGFRSKLAWASHAARMHDYRTLSTRLASGVVCQGCGKAFANTGRLRRHLAHSSSCRSSWGRLVPAQGATAMHPQMPPTAVQCNLACDPQREAKEVCQELCAALDEDGPEDPDEVLAIVSRHLAPIGELRGAVEAWGASCPASSRQRAAAMTTASLLTPANFCDAVKPLPLSSLNLEEFPVFEPLAPFSFATEGEVHSFFIGNSPVCSAAWPWEHYGTLTAANARASWVADAVQLCMEAIRVSAERPVEIHFDTTAAAAIPAALAWFTAGGFLRDGLSFRSPVSPEFSC